MSDAKKVAMLKSQPFMPRSWAHMKPSWLILREFGATKQDVAQYGAILAEKVIVMARTVVAALI
jgi:hypothetical protein